MSYRKEMKPEIVNLATPMTDPRPEAVQRLSQARCLMFLGGASTSGFTHVTYTEVSAAGAAELLGQLPNGHPRTIGVHEGEIVVSTAIPELRDPNNPMLLTREEQLVGFVTTA